MPEKETGTEEAKKEQPEKEIKKGEKAKLEEALAKANADRDYWKNEYYKVFADTQNLRKSLTKDVRIMSLYPIFTQFVGYRQLDVTIKKSFIGHRI